MRLGLEGPDIDNGTALCRIVSIIVRKLPSVCGYCI